MTGDFDAAEYAGARALVFGATGFIGRHVAAALSAAGAAVTLSGREPRALDRLAGGLEAADVIECDICDDARVVATIRQARPHITFNLAGYGVDRTERDEALAQRINGRFAGILCGAVAAGRAEEWGGQALIHAGTQLEYGPVGGDLAEQTEPAPHTLYGRTKLEGTLSLARCASSRGLPALTARLFTVYGPGEHENRLLPSIIGAVRTGEPLDMTDGLQRMDFTWVGDVAGGLLRLGVVPATADGRTGPDRVSESRHGMVVNLASGRLLSVREFATQAVEALDGDESLLRFGALRRRSETLEYEPVTNARLRALTGWAPAMTVTEGIRSMIGEDWTHA